MGFPLVPSRPFFRPTLYWTDGISPFGSNSMQVLPGVFILRIRSLIILLWLLAPGRSKDHLHILVVLPGITMHTLLHYPHPKKEDYLIRIPGSLFYMMNHYLLLGLDDLFGGTKFSIVAAPTNSCIF